MNLSCARCGATDDVLRLDWWRTPDPNGTPLCRVAGRCFARRDASHSAAYLIRHHLAVPSHSGWHPTIRDLQAIGVSDS